MRILLILILGFGFLVGCKNIDYRPKYSDFNNDWESDNLIGKVKSLYLYKANVIDFETEAVEYPIINLKKDYTYFGKISYQENYDIYGKYESYVKRIYDEKGNNINLTYENFSSLFKTGTTTIFDDEGKSESSIITFDDTAKIMTFHKYDSLGNLISVLSIENGDTTYGNFEYKYNDSGQILLKKQFDSNGNTFINWFKYDQKDNLLEEVIKSEFIGKLKTTYEYDHLNRIKKITQYNSGQIEKETFFDKFYNQISTKIYVDEFVKREMKYEYDFDDKGNWIKRKVFLKEYFRDDKSFKQIYQETRTLEYYE